MTKVLEFSNINLDEERWRRVLARDRGADGSFYFAVKTTGIYCLPSCPSRRPKRENVEFFTVREAAVRNGFRACLRCRPEEFHADNADQRLIASVCNAVTDHVGDRLPTLEALAARCGLSPHHLQRRFKALMGVSPRAYADECRRRHFRSLLRSGDQVAGALYEAGYGSASRLYENAETWLGMTPASYAKGGKGASMYYAIEDSPLQRMIVSATDRGVAFLGFGDTDEELIEELKQEFPHADIRADSGQLSDTISRIVESFDNPGLQRDVPLDVQGTAFQARVWRALQDIPPGETRTYGQLAAELGKPNAARAVGRACATNPVSLVVPCHRAVGSDGSLTGYRWGVDRKRTLLDHERVQQKT